PKTLSSDFLGSVTSQIRLTGLGQSLSGLSLHLNFANENANGMSVILTSPDGTSAKIIANDDSYTNPIGLIVQLHSYQFYNDLTNITLDDAGSQVLNHQTFLNAFLD